MNKKLSVWFCLPLLVGVVALSACSSGKTDKVYGYTYDELIKVEDKTCGITSNEKITKVEKYENEGEIRYLLVSKDDDQDDPVDIYLSLSSNYIEKHRTNQTDHYIYGRDQDKPDIGKVLESYKVDVKTKTFEKETD